MAGKRHVSATEFRARCLALLDQVAETRETLVVTKRGSAVAHVVPADAPRSLRGTVEYLVDDDELIKPLHEDW
jgi:prevent-host-death family protein